MKKYTHKIALAFITVLLVACVNAFDKADSLIGQMQDDVTKIINELSHIQTSEGQLQDDFETTIAKDQSLQLFLDETSPIMSNIDHRQENLNNIDTTLSDLMDLIDELLLLDLKEPQHLQAIDLIEQQVNHLNDDLTVYLVDYEDNLAIETVSFQAVAHPEADYQSFFDVIHNINTVGTTNSVNLDQVLSHFEGLNSNLVNLKVAIVDAQNSQ